jgi:hypothetical protein
LLATVSSTNLVEDAVEFDFVKPYFADLISSQIASD